MLTDDAGAVVSLVLRHAGLVGTRRLVPADHVVEVIGSTVHLDLAEREIEALPEYRDTPTAR